MAKRNWMCEICGTRFSTRKSAAKCERMHKTRKHGNIEDFPRNLLAHYKKHGTRPESG